MRQVLYAIRKQDQAAILLARHGEEHVKNTCVDYMRRDIEGVEPGELWIADHRQFDMLVQIPGPDGNPIAVRPWVCAIMDARSREFCGWRVDANPMDSVAIAETIANAILLSGAPPKVMLSDNG
jgi:transposase InsO family protein